jgi:hypothetical protein
MWIGNDSMSSSNTETQFNSANLTTESLEWPVGATKFSIDAVPVGVESDLTTTIVTGVSIPDPQSTNYSGVGPFAVETVTFITTTKSFKWNGADSDEAPESTNTIELPLYFSGQNNVPGRYYLYDFGLLQCNDETCSSPERVNEITKDANNDEINFYMSTFNDAPNPPTIDQPIGVNFLIAFSGRWHF